MNMVASFPAELMRLDRSRIILCIGPRAAMVIRQDKVRSLPHIGETNQRLVQRWRRIKPERTGTVSFEALLLWVTRHARLRHGNDGQLVGVAVFDRLLLRACVQSFVDAGVTTGPVQLSTARAGEGYQLWMRTAGIEACAMSLSLDSKPGRDPFLAEWS